MKGILVKRLLTWGMTVITLAAFGVGMPSRAFAADDASSLTVLASTDVHAHLVNWDYFGDKAYPTDAKRKQPLGLEYVSSIVKSVRTAKGADSVVVVDNGDYIQGTPLSYLAAARPATFTGKPLSQAMNLIGYDAQNLGNHEFNYGLPYLHGYEGQLNAPLLGANVIDTATGAPAFKPTTMLTKTVSGNPVKVGIVGVVTTGVKMWDKANVEGKLTFLDPVTTADKYATQLKADGADVVIVLAHMGLDSPVTPYTPTSDPENVATSVAAKARNVDVVITGHTHLDAPKTVVAGASGHDVMISQAFYWARGMVQVSLPLTFNSGKPVVNYAALDAKPLYAMDYPSDSAFTNDPVIKQAHAATVAYVNSKVGTSTEELSAAASRYQDTPILDFIGKVQEDTVRQALKGTKYDGIPVITEVSPFSRTAVFPKGDLRIKDIAGLYVFDNTLGAIKLTGKQVKEYLEWSARYFVKVDAGATFNPETGTNASYGGGSAIPDYNYDALTGVTYSIDVSKPVGERIIGLSYQCAPVKDTDSFIMAINNYRMSGAGAASFVKDAPVVWNELLEIRQLLIDHATKVKTVDPKDFYVENWRLTTSGEAFTPASCNVPASVTVAPTSAQVGGKVTVTGTGFTAGETVRIELHSTPVVLASVTADSAGAISATVTVPAVTPGEHSIVAVGETSGRQASAPLTVAARLLPTTGSADSATLVLGLAFVAAGLLIGASRRQRA